MATCNPVSVVQHFYELRLNETELQILQRALSGDRTIGDAEKQQLYATISNALNGAIPTIRRSE